MHTPSPHPPISTQSAPAATPAIAAPPVRWSRALTVIFLLALVALGLAWELTLAPTGHRTLAIKVLPLLWPLGGVLRFHMRSYRVLSLMVWLYVTEGLVRATSSSNGLTIALATAEVLLCVALFCACAWHVRLRLKAPRLAPEENLA